MLSVALKPLARVVVLLALISGCTPAYAEETAKPIDNPAELLISDSAATESAQKGLYSFWPWANGEAQQPPKAKPYKIPTLSGDELDFKAKPPALVKAPKVDADAVYQYVLDCYPEASKWNLDVNLRGQIASTPDSILSSEGTNSTELGSSYVAIVASLPLYSSKELNREKERESLRRQDVAGTVSNFIAALASRNHAIRELALYRSLEARAAIRVQQGITEAAEQVKYLEKVAASHEALIKQEAKITESRLKLAGMCDPLNARSITTWLKTISAVPHQEPEG